MIRLQTLVLASILCSSIQAFALDCDFSKNHRRTPSDAIEYFLKQENCQARDLDSWKSLKGADIGSVDNDNMMIVRAQVGIPRNGRDCSRLPGHSFSNDPESCVHTETFRVERSWSGYSFIVRERIQSSATKPAVRTETSADATGGIR